MKEKSINAQIMDKLTETFEFIKNHENLDKLPLVSFSDLEREFQSIMDTLDPPYIFKGNKGA